MSRGSVSFRQLLRYMQKGAVKGKGMMLWNLRSDTDDAGILEREFLDNSRYAKERKNGVTLYHEVLAFSPKDAGKLTAATMIDLAGQYLLRRAPDALAYAVIHDTTLSPHIHLLISGNALYSSKQIRCSKAEFARIKWEIEAYQQEAYPELLHSIAQKSPPEATRRTRAEAERERRQRAAPSPTPSNKEMIARKVRACLVSGTLAEFRNALSAEGLTVYIRGAAIGVIAQESGRRYRMTTLTVADEFARALDRWQAHRERQEAAAGLHAAKWRKEWRETAFRDQVADTILCPETASRRARRKRRGMGWGG